MTTDPGRDTSSCNKISSPVSSFYCFQDLSERVENYQPEFDATIKCGEDVIKEPSVQPATKEKVEDELASLKERWLEINRNLDALMSR